MGEQTAASVWGSIVAGEVGGRVSVMGQAVAKRFRGRGCGFLDLQASREALSFDPALGEPLEIIVDGGARAVLKPVHLGDVVRVEGFIQETRRPGAMAVRLGKGFLTNTATAPHGEFVPPEHQDRVYDLKDLPCPLERVCKFFVNNNGRCHRKVCDDVHIQISGRARKEYMERMRESKSAASHHVDDLYEMHEKEKHANRARVFAEWLVDTFTLAVLQSGSGVVDVAGGKGELAVELAALGIPVTVIDPRQNLAPTRRLRQLVNRMMGGKMSKEKCVAWRLEHTRHLKMLLDDEVDAEVKAGIFRDCSVVVGMHPDQATGYVQSVAMEFDKPYAIVPCCVFSDEFTDRFVADRDGEHVPVRTHEELVRWLLARDPRNAEAGWLKFHGKNRVVWSLCTLPPS
ncbi:hypothetical protein Pmar_PMAR001050 [Perkinsus marinus ATCC 50983]|uniref:C3H1-type domain-containing protein n=1 Tax=Perkinsus marinus (strain ATCC 50983 / TXsc) TaxID=423536 RepID=C5KTE8_PERM5|nr:hypothetical protein Pmar_PMAR001050 [Perkinsus marinus ATCC 50983]EER12253.1 hypothetical protein Pmar_PMAR001050 [Perkinsus marinus ATCC 50983]|eukprot:XP_002780458.1 hypothetical protein Pmar_PMAR001050 [Perkinsus marinus ATCC 50983]